MSTQTNQPMFRVLLLNDDHTPMEFVVHVLECFFERDRETATQIMLRTHNDGIAECGIYEYDLAKTKVSQVSILRGNISARFNAFLSEDQPKFISLDPEFFYDKSGCS
jgi:hypothetical protein